MNADDEHTIRHYLESRFKSTFEERVARALELRPQLIVPNHHFAQASTECVYLYRDGYFLATAMTTQAVCEGLIRFIAERNAIAPNQDLIGLVGIFLAKNIVSQSCSEAMNGILKSFRNDFHHQNPSIATVPVQGIAKRNIEDLATIEKEIFDHAIENGKLSPKQPKYWDATSNGTFLVNIRFG